jgi:hypothetical protein
MAPGPSSTADSTLVAACVEQYPASEPFDVGTTPEPASPPSSGVEEAQPAPSALDGIEEECIAGRGIDCDSTRFISDEAAICVSQGSGVAEADSWTASLEVRGAPARVRWQVLGSGPPDTQCCAAGWWFWVDAISGEILSHTDAQKVCCPEYDR